MQMQGNTIFITGSTSGIGRALAEAFHRLGNKVIVSGRRQALIDEIVAANPGMAGIALDITDAASIQAAAKQLLAEHPDVNVLINNAGIMPFDDPGAPIADALVDRIYTTNFLGPIRMTSALIEHLKAKPYAAILNNTSVLAYVPIATNGVYSALKAALHSYTLSQRFQLRDTHVQVQEIAPPWVDTDLIHKSGDPRAMPLDAFIAETMAKLGGDSPEVIVDAIQMLRDNPGSGEHAFFDGFNQSMVEDPIPVAA